MKQITTFLLGILAGAGSSLFAQAYGNAGNTQRADNEKTYYNPYSQQYEPLYSQKQQAVFVDAQLPSNNMVELEANIMMNVKVSSYLAIFSVTQTGESLILADSLMTKKIDLFMSGVGKAGIKTEDVHIDFISWLPVYDINEDKKILTNTGTEVTSGYKMKKNIHVRFFSNQQLDKVITAAAKAGIYDLVTVDYNVGDMTLIQDSLRNVAIDVINHKKKLYEKMGFDVTVEIIGEGNDSKYPVERYDQYTAYLNGSSKKEIAKNNPEIKVKEAEKEQTVYYNRVPYKQFDKVLNADLVEPSVQYFYRLRVRCKLQTPEQKKILMAQQTKSAAKAPVTPGR